MSALVRFSIAITLGILGFVLLCYYVIVNDPGTGIAWLFACCVLAEFIRP